MITREELKKYMDKAKNKDTENKIAYLERNIDYNKKRIEEINVDIRNYKEGIEELARLIYSSAKACIEQNSEGLNYVKDAYVKTFKNEKYIAYILKDVITQKEPMTGKQFYFGDLEILIPFKEFTPTYVFNLTETRNGFGNNMQTHRIGDSGIHTSFDITDSRNQRPYLVRLINYLTNVDIGYSNGYFIASWKEVKKDGEIVDNGQRMVLRVDGTIEKYDD